MKRNLKKNYQILLNQANIPTNNFKHSLSYEYGITPHEWELINLTSNMYFNVLLHNYGKCYTVTKIYEVVLLQANKQK